MPSYQAESFYRAQIKTPILSTTAVPFTINVSRIPTISNGLLTISPNTEFEEICEYNNPNGTNLTIDIVKRGILPSSILLTTATVDYNNPLYYKEHTQNDIIRGDVNHIHINQGIGNTTLATNVGVGISKLSVAAADPADPIVVGTNDPRVGDASTTVKATVKLSVAPVNPANPIAVGDNDPRLAPSDATLTFTDITTNNVSTTKHGFAPKAPNNVDVQLDGTGAYSRAVPSGATIQWLTNTAPTGWLLADGTAVNRTTYATLFAVVGTTYGVGDGATTFNLPNLKGRVAVGRDAAQAEFDVLGETGGAKTHTLDITEIPAHTHTVPRQADSSGGVPNGNFATNDQPNAGTYNTGSSGGGGAHNNLQPYLVINYIIKT